MTEAYRVRKQFGWNGREYAPKGPDGECSCPCSAEPKLRCTMMVGSGCICHDRSCRCSCGIRPEQYGGDVWFVEDGHPRKEFILVNHFATYDASLKSVDELLAQSDNEKLLEPLNPKKRGRVASAKL